MRRKYDEAAEWRRYIWDSCRHMLTEREWAVFNAALVASKVRGAPEAWAAKLRQSPGYFFDDDVAAVIEHGFDAYRQKCCARLVMDYGDQIFIHRCERCARIVASPVSCVCLWCGHLWVERRAEVAARARSPIYPPPLKW